MLGNPQSTDRFFAHVVIVGGVLGTAASLWILLRYAGDAGVFMFLHHLDFSDTILLIVGSAPIVFAMALLIIAIMCVSMAVSTIVTSIFWGIIELEYAYSGIRTEVVPPLILENLRWFRTVLADAEED
jgi:hypothetical protein